MAVVFLEASFGGVRIDVESSEDTADRAVVAFKAPHVDGARTVDMGAEPRITSLRIVFCPTSDPTDDPYERFLNFKLLVDQGDAQELIHPLTGVYLARVEKHSFSASHEEDAVRVSATFIEEGEPVTLFLQPTAGTPLLAGVAAVQAAAAAVDAALATVNAATGGTRASAIGQTANARASSWLTDGDLRRVNMELVAFNTELDGEMSRLNVATDVACWPIVQTMTNLGYALSQCARAIAATTPRRFQITVAQPASLLALIVAAYGSAAQALDRYDQILALNDVPNPALIPAGTVLAAPSPPSSRSRSPL